MRLLELSPRWIHPNMFVFRCPHCPESGILLTCKNIQMDWQEQRDLLDKEFGEDFGHTIVPCNPDSAWTITGTIPTDQQQVFADNVTVTPSIDASKSGHWHGFITNGEIK